MIGGIFKKLFSTKPEKEEPKNKLAESLMEKSQELYEGFFKKAEEVKEELISMKYKYDNLLETNYNLGLTHIENGNISDAIFRFRFIRKFWPNFHEALYQLAYCLILNKKIAEAKKVLEELLVKEPQHQQGHDLLELINKNQAQNPQN